MEMVTTEVRPIIVLLIGSFGVLGSITMAIIAWLSPNWRIFLVYIYVPQFIFIFYIFWMDESPRWLLSKGKKTEAENILRKAAKINRITIDENKLSKLKCEESSTNTSLLPLLKMTCTSKKLFLRLLCCICMWFTGLFNAYALTINSVSLKGNKFINYSITTGAGLPASVLLYFLLIKCNRKKPLIFSFLFTAIFCIGHSFLPSGMLRTISFKFSGS